MREIHSESQTIDMAYERTEYTLYELVGNEVKRWDTEKIKHEAWKSSDIMLSESPHSHPKLYGVVLDRALTLWQNNMRRLNKDLLNESDDKTLLTVHDIWPNSMDKWECREILEELHEREIPNEYWTQAQSEVSQGIVNKLTDFEVNE